MKAYIKNSFQKFKGDALAKGIYDIIKWLVIFLIVFVFTKAIPEGTKISELLKHTYIFTFYWIIIYTILLILLSLVAAYWIFKRKYKQLESDNYTDELTGLKNHKALKQYLETQLIELEKDVNKATSLILIDIDDFKQFNSSHGYNTSDQLLKKLGELLGNDKRVTDETFRFFNRGDEFLIVANETSASSALLAAERKRKLIEKATFMIDDKSYHLKVSCGVTEYKRSKDNYISFINRVISALMEAKKQKNKNNSKLII